MKVGNKLTRVYARVYVCMYVGKHVCLRIPCVRCGSVLSNTIRAIYF